MKTKLLITGGAGFIGSNVAHHFASKDYQIRILDNFKRRGTKDNLNWLLRNHKDIEVYEGDVRKMHDVEKAVKKQQVIFHLAAQVAVTTSVIDPRTDFDINALGTFNLLESARQEGKKPIIIFSSTNKVYGGMEEIEIVEKNEKYIYKKYPKGISEKMNLDFHSPYGCSKGAADQYVHDYNRIYDLPTVVFRQSCIYGPRQFGVEDQGWIAWFIIATTLGKKITIYGDGKQVRDVLYVDDLVRLFETAVKQIEKSSGKIYNVGGGVKKTLSVWHEFGPILERLFTRKIEVKFDTWRPGDQKVYVSDISRVKNELGWEPKVPVEKGIEKLFHWVQENKSLFNNFK